MKTWKIIFACSALVWMSACRNDNAAPDSRPPESPQANSGTNKPEILLYATCVDNLLLREQPNKQGKVIDKFREGDFVVGSGIVSENKEEVVLRDIPYNEPYIKVSSTLRQMQGWAYGGGLLCIYAGTKAGSPELSHLSQLSKFTTTLNTQKLENGKRVWKFVTDNFSQATGAEADAAFILTESFLRRMEIEGEYYTQIERLPWSSEEINAVAADSFDMKKYPATSLLAENGFRLETAEGMVYPVVDWPRLKAFFADKCSNSMRMFIDQRVEEQLHQEYDDGGIIIPLEQVADRAVFWEKFNKSNPYFPLQEETRSSEEFGRQLLVTGADNTPIFDYDTKAISPEFRKMWDYVLTKYPDTKTAGLVRQMSNLCASEGWKRTDKVEAFVAQVMGIDAQ